VLFAGGLINGEPTDLVERLDLQNLTWSTSDSLSSADAGMQAFSLNNHAVFVGR
jgi:hypothetical protein